MAIENKIVKQNITANLELEQIQFLNLYAKKHNISISQALRELLKEVQYNYEYFGEK